MKLILIRHGQTQWNASQRYQGHTDIPLNDTGRQQALRLADYLVKDEAVEAVYCSDLSRARETAEIIGRAFKLQPHPDHRLREFCFGKWEGLTFTQVYAAYRSEFEQWFNNLEEFRVPGGESFSDLASRSLEAIEEIKKKHAGTAVVVTHGGVIKAMLRRIRANSDPWQETVPPGSLTRIDFLNERIEIPHIGLAV